MVVCAPCGSGLGRDAASAGRRLRSRTQSRASTLPQPSAQDRATDFRGRQPLLRTGPESGAARCPPPPSGSRPLPQSLAPAVDRLRPLLEQPLVAAALLWQRPCCGSGPVVGAALAATRPLLSAGFDTGRCRGRKTPPTRPRLRPRILRAPRGSDLCGSGLGRDAAAVVHRLRYRLPSGSEDPSHRNPAPATDRESGAPPVGAALAATRPLRSAGSDTGCRRGRKTPPTETRLRPPTASLAPPVGDSMFRRKRFRAVSGHSRPHSSSVRRQRERAFGPAQRAPGCG